MPLQIRYLFMLNIRPTSADTQPVAAKPSTNEKLRVYRHNAGGCKKNSGLRESQLELMHKLV